MTTDNEEFLRAVLGSDSVNQDVHENGRTHLMRDGCNECRVYTEWVETTIKGDMALAWWAIRHTHDHHRDLYLEVWSDGIRQEFESGRLDEVYGQRLGIPKVAVDLAASGEHYDHE